MARRILFLLLFQASSFLYAQPFGNEWINYEQTYFKIKVWSDGVYRIPWSTLQVAIPDLNGTDPRKIQLFARGEQQAIYIAGESDSTWNDGDFIEFIGLKNTGWLDAQLYPQLSDQSNPYYSLFTDTSTYFLTWNNAVNNRRMQVETDQAFNAFGPAAPYFIHEVINQLTSSYYFGKTDYNNSTDPEYTEGEGWSGPNIAAPVNNQTRQLPSTNAVTSGPDATLRIVYKTVSNAGGATLNHRYLLQLGTSPVLDTLMAGHGSRRFNLTISSSALGATTTPFKFSYPVIGPGITSNSVYSNYVWRYPHNFNLENKTSFKLFLPDNSAFSKSFLSISNFNANGTNALFYDLTNGKRIVVTLESGIQKSLVPNGGGALKECLITSESQVQLVTQIEPLNYVGTPPGKFNNLTAFGGSKFVIISHPSLSAESQTYKTYRSGKFSTEVFYVDELFDQFSFGIKQHPLGIRKFIETAFAYWSEKPEYLFFLGKSISAHYLRTDPLAWRECLVPTFGFPSSDNLFSAGLNQSLQYEPAAATGRLAAKNGSDVLAYLDKLQEYESAEPALWMKQVLHFGGGQSIGEQQTYLNYLRTYENTIEDTLFGGTVYTYQKTSSEPIEQTQSAIIADYINNGVSLMTFFGHATGSGFDVSIDDPASYTNQGKYPFLIGNSCYAGDIHQPPGYGFSQSEQFTLIPQKGTIGFIASVSLGIPNQLHTYTDTLYKYIGMRHYGDPVGLNMKRTIHAIHSNNQYRKAIMLETTLHGDPGVALNNQDKPDYLSSEPEVYFDPEEVTTEVDSFTLHIILSNVGRAINGDLVVEVVRNFPTSGLTTTYQRGVNNLFYKDTLHIRMPVLDQVKGGVGINTFSIRIDPLNQYNELSEQNNNITKTLIIRSAEVLPVWPYEFALLPTDTLTLRASTGDPFAPARNYVFEIDTTDLFNSPFKQSVTINQVGGILNWRLPFTLQDSMAYFWRVSPDSVAGGNWKWKESSFQHIVGKRGWSQDHFFQFKKDRFNQIDYLRPQRKFDFVSNAKEISCYAYGYPYTFDELWGTSYKIDAEVWADAGCSFAGAVYIAVIDSVTLLPWLSPQNCYDQGNQFGQFNSNCSCKSGNRMANFVFRNQVSTTEMGAMRDMLNSIPNGNYILAYTWILGNYQTWDPTVMQAFLDLGADSIQYLPNEAPYIFFVQKGHPETAIELIADSANANLVLSTPMYNSWVSGDFSSTQIGPGSGWDTLSWAVNSFDNAMDSVRIQVTGITANGVENVIVEAVTDASGNLNLAPLIGETQYTYLRLNVFMRDDSLRTPVQLDRWQVTFDPVPECALNPLAGLYFHKDTLQQGDSLKMAIAIQNISELPMDSMLVAYWVMDANRNIHPINYTRQKPLLPGEILFDTISVSTLPFSGLNTIWVEANPNFDQPEQFRFNNLGSLNFYIGTDQINPLLDVTFDGTHILNGDIISPHPEIVIQLKDENPYLALNDTSSFQLFLRRPGQTSAQGIFFNNNPKLTFIPGSLPANKARLELKSHFKEDGKYDFIVKARDRSNNASGSVQYKISFEVINKASITNILNYPNPFSTQTRFVFTLTGSQIPDEFRIQIMTITGKVIKDIRREELGTIRIGRNVTEYAWDGKDEFGDQLANGIYLYRVMTSIAGEKIEQRESGADSYIDQGYGKMYLMR
jgi:hypothetical protein